MTSYPSATRDCPANLGFSEHTPHATHCVVDFLFRLSLTPILQGGYYSPHFPNGETEALRA